MDLKGRIVIYTITGCPHCLRAKSKLRELELPYTDVNLDNFPQCREPLAERTGKNTVPQIFFNATHIGGNDDFQKLVEERENFEKLVEDVKNTTPPPEAPVPPDPSTAVEQDQDKSKKDESSGFSCEPDEYAKLVKEIKSSDIIQNHRAGLFTVHKNSFSGNDLVDWIVKAKAIDRSKAIEMGQQLVDRHYAHSLSKHPEFLDNPSSFYRLVEDEETSALNVGAGSECLARPAVELARDLRKLILKLYGSFLSEDGKAVDYKGIGQSEDFQKYLEMTRDLQRVQIEDASREEKIAFFINIYNALVIHATVKNGPAVNIWQRYKFFNKVRYIIGGYSYSLQDIENGILRANRKGIGMLFKPFGKSDPRLKVALQKHEPLIHFALVCGAKSCPPIKTYTSERIYDQLNLAAKSFLEGDDGCSVDMENHHVKLSKILKWYGEDFGSNDEEVLLWVHEHLREGDKKSQIAELLAEKSFKISYWPYDWAVNAK